MCSRRHARVDQLRRFPPGKRAQQAEKLRASVWERMEQTVGVVVHSMWAPSRRFTGLAHNPLCALCDVVMGRYFRVEERMFPTGEPVLVLAYYENMYVVVAVVCAVRFGSVAVTREPRIQVKSWS